MQWLISGSLLVCILKYEKKNEVIEMLTIGPSKRGSRGREEGAVLILLALALSAIFGLAALAIDLTVLATAKQEADSLSRFASLAAVEDFFGNETFTSIAPETYPGGVNAYWADRAESASKRAQAVVSGQGSVPTTVALTNVPSEAEGASPKALLEFGKWHFSKPASDDPCNGKYPCFVNEAGGAASAVRLSGKLISPVSPLFGSVFGASAYAPQVQATAAIIPRHGCFLVDMSPSMSSRTHTSNYGMSSPEKGRGKLVSHILSKDVNNSSLVSGGAGDPMFSFSDALWSQMKNTGLGRPSDLSVQPSGFDTSLDPNTELPKYDISAENVFRRIHYACKQNYEAVPSCGTNGENNETMMPVCKRQGVDSGSGYVSWTSTWTTQAHQCQELGDRLGLNRIPGKVTTTERYLGSCRPALDALVTDKAIPADCYGYHHKFKWGQKIPTCRRVGKGEQGGNYGDIQWTQPWLDVQMSCGQIANLIGRKTNVAKDKFKQVYSGECVDGHPQIGTVDETGQGGGCTSPILKANARLGSDYTLHKTLGDSHYNAENNTNYVVHHPDPNAMVCTDPEDTSTCHPEGQDAPELDVRTSPFWYRVDTFRTDEEPGYYGPEPLRQVFEGLNYAVNALEQRAVAGDKACFIFYDEKLTWPRIVHLTGGQEGFNYLKKISDFNNVRNEDGGILVFEDDSAAITDADLTDPATEGLLLTIRHKLFPLPGSKTNTQLALARALIELDYGAEDGVPSSDFLVLIGDGMANCERKEVTCAKTRDACTKAENLCTEDFDLCMTQAQQQPTSCSNDLSNHQGAIEEIMETVDNHLVPRNVPVHVMPIGDHVGPHTLDLSAVPLRLDADGNPEGATCITDEEARKSNIKIVRGLSDAEVTNDNFKGASYEGGKQYFEVNEYLYDIARKTRGLWMPVRPNVNQDGSACQEHLLCFSNNPLTAERIITDPECRDIGDQIIDYMSKIIAENPYMVVETG